MAYTTNFSLEKPTNAATAEQFLASHNANMDKIDAMPLPIESAVNSTLTYQRFADGILHMFGAVDYGTQYPCYNEWAPSAGYASDTITLNFPVALASTDYSLQVFVATDKNPDMWAVSSGGRHTNKLVFNFLCAINDSTNINSKVLNIDIWGRWR